MALLYNILYLKLVCFSLSFKLCDQCSGSRVEYFFYYDDLTDLNDVRGNIGYNTRISPTESSVVTISSTELSVITISSTDLSVITISSTELSVITISPTELSVITISSKKLSVITIFSTELSVITISSTELSVITRSVRTDTFVEEIYNTHCIR